MRRNRIVWFALWVLSLVGISFYGGPIPYCFFALTTSIPIMALIYLLCVYFSFKIYQERESKNLICKQPSSFYFTLQNESFFAFSGIRVIFFSDFSKISGLDEKLEYELHPGQGIKLATKLVPLYRGEYEIGVKQVVMQDFLRLFRLTFKNPETMSVIVKPNLVALETLQTEEYLMQSFKDSPYQATKQDVLVREYMQGDQRDRIQWKATARLDQLMVRKQIGEEENGIGILLDTKRCSADAQDYIPVENKMLETVLALTYYFVKKGIPVQNCLLQGTLTEHRIGQLQAFDRFYEEVSLVHLCQGQKCWGQRRIVPRHLSRFVRG